MRRLEIHIIATLAALGLGLACPLARSEVPHLSSDPEAPHVLFLDFDGFYLPSETSNCPEGGVEGWSVDIHTTDISGQLSYDEIRSIWETVAEDYAPFLVNVTTDPRFDPQSSTGANAVRVAIGETAIDPLGIAPASCENTLRNPPYFNPNIPNATMVRLDPNSRFYPTDIGKRASHEAGHVYGLKHHLAGALTVDDWIMAPQRSSSRNIWRVGSNESNQRQDDIEHLTWVLGRRSDESNPRWLTLAERRTTRGTEVGGYYAHATLTSPNDYDEFYFEVPTADQLRIRVVSGTWADPFDPIAAAEPNVRYHIEVRTQSGGLKLICVPAGELVLPTTTQSVINTPNCQRLMPLRIGVIYRVRVYRDPADSLPGNLGRYTLHIGWSSRKPQPGPPIRRL